MLSVAGLLDPTMYGPGTLDENSRRRSIYFTVKRSRLIPMLMVLDWPEPLNSIGARPVTTVAPQALLFLNSPQARGYAQALADRVKSPEAAGAIERAYRLALQRMPTQAEVGAAETFIESQARIQASQSARPGVNGADRLLPGAAEYERVCVCRVRTCT